jgi:cytochrome P450
MSGRFTATAPPQQWLFGHFRAFRRDPLAFLSACARDHGDAVPLRFAHRRALLLSDPQLIAEVLVARHRSFRKHFALRLARPALGDGLLLSEGAAWLGRRQLMQPAFRAERLGGYATLMAGHAGALVASWREGAAIDLHRQLMELTARIVTQCLFGSGFDGQGDDAHAAMTILTDSFKARLDSVVRLPLYLPTPANLRFRRGMARLDRLIGGIISQRRAGPARGDLLQALLDARSPDGGPGLDDRQLRDEVVTLFVAGHETTANALSWTQWLLAAHPQVQSRLELELDRVLAGRAPDAGDVPQLPYCAQVIEEAMRLMPPAWIIGREALADIDLGPCRVPRGTTVLMSQWVVQRDPRWFSDAASFRPERWADGLAERLPAFAYFPFGGGPRHCIGAGFARMEMVLLLATMAARFRLELAPGAVVEAVPTITLRPRYGLPMIVRARPARSVAASAALPGAPSPASVPA